MKATEFLELGEAAIKAIGAPTDVKKRTEEETQKLDKFAKRRGISTPVCYKAIDAARKFTKAQAKDLDKLGIRSSKVECVLKIEDEKERMQLLKKAAKEKWSTSEFRAQLALVIPTRPYGGRHAKKKNVPHILEHLRGLCTQIESHAVLLSELSNGDARVPTAITQRIKELRQSAQKLSIQLRHYQASRAHQQHHPATSKKKKRVARKR